jgi:hypothetical protein
MKTVAREDTEHYDYVISHHRLLSAATAAASRHESRSAGAHRCYRVLSLTERHPVGSRIRTS